MKGTSPCKPKKTETTFIERRRENLKNETDARTRESAYTGNSRLKKKTQEQLGEPETKMEKHA